MHSSWFQKPAYKIARILAIVLLAGGFLSYWSSMAIWPVFFVLLALVLAFQVIASYFIQSGFYITTINKGNEISNKLAITFDDGPCPQTLEILEILDRFHSGATFFIIGRKAEQYPEIVKLIHEKKHTIGNHSYQHLNWFPVMLPAQIKNEINKTQKIIKDLTGKETVYFRPPFGVTNPLIAKALTNSKLKITGWSIRSMDTVSENPQKIINRVKKRIKPGTILLLHDTSKNVLPVLEELLVYCSKNNLKPVNLDEFLSN